MNSYLFKTRVVFCKCRILSFIIKNIVIAVITFLGKFTDIFFNPKLLFLVRNDFFDLVNVMSSFLFSFDFVSQHVRVKPEAL